ncbi:MAG: succinylglutamate desuccinylase/aspartoacylase family protein [Balneola sp.]
MDIITEKEVDKADSLLNTDRIIGRVEGAEPGPTILALAGIHGNEPTGIKAIEHVLEMLKGLEDKLRGTFIGIRGNLEALEKGERFIDEDMNRIWFTSILDKVRRTPINDLKTAERRETKAVLEVIDPYIHKENKEYPIVFADLHTFSSENGLFAISSRDSKNEELLSKLKIPLIFGIEKALHGTALKYVQNAGNISFAFEAGMHFSEKAEFNATAGLYALLVATECLDVSYIPDYKSYNDFLVEQTSGLPDKVEFVYKHIVEVDDEFEMKAGFKNFDRIKKGDWLANDKLGKIEAQVDGYILMPLYQKQGSDGFFIVRDIE